MLITFEAPDAGHEVRVWSLCGAAVYNLAAHKAWHEKVDREIWQAGRTSVGSRWNP